MANFISILKQIRFGYKKGLGIATQTFLKKLEFINSQYSEPMLAFRPSDYSGFRLEEVENNYSSK